MNQRISSRIYIYMRVVGFHLLQTDVRSRNSQRTDGGDIGKDRSKDSCKCGVADEGKDKGTTEERLCIL